MNPRIYLYGTAAAIIVIELLMTTTTFWTIYYSFMPLTW